MTGTTSYTIDAYTASVAGSIVFTVDDRSQANVAVEYKGAATNWETVPMYDDGTNGDATAGDNVWSVTIENIPAGTHEWGAIENDGSEYGIWLINGPNPAFTLMKIYLPIMGIPIISYQFLQGKWMSRLRLLTILG